VSEKATNCERIANEMGRNRNHPLLCRFYEACADGDGALAQVVSLVPQGSVQGMEATRILPV